MVSSSFAEIKFHAAYVMQIERPNIDVNRCIAADCLPEDESISPYSVVQREYLTEKKLDLQRYD